jgi:hypothetical protein
MMKENTIGRALRAPWVVVRAGGLTLLIYLVGGVVGVSWLSEYSVNWLLSIIYDSSIELNLDDWWVSILNILAKALVAVLTVPIYLTIFSLPVRLIAIHGRLPPRELLDLSLISFRLGIKSLFLSISSAFFLVLPLVGMIVFYRAMSGRIESVLFLRIYPLVCGLVSLPILFKATSLISAPIISIVGQLNAFIAVRDCRVILKGFKIEFFSILIAVLAIYSGFDYLLTEFEFSDSTTRTVNFFFVPSIIWLACVMTSWIVVESFWKAAERLEKQTRGYINNQASIGSATSSAAPIAVESDREASSLPEAQREIFVHVQNLHLHKK